jgi:opacity protein-like surface antigen
MRKLTGFTLLAIVFSALPCGAVGLLSVTGGAHGGYASYSCAGTSNGGMDFGANANVSAGPLLSVQLIADYFTYSETIEGTNAEVKSTDIPIGIHMLYGVSLPGSPIKPYAGVGPSIHLISGETTISDSTSETSDTKFGIGGVAGAEFKMMPKIALFFEIRDHIIFTDVENTNALYILGGVNFKLM